MKTKGKSNYTEKYQSELKIYEIKTLFSLKLLSSINYYPSFREMRNSKNN